MHRPKEWTEWKVNNSRGFYRVQRKVLLHPSCCCSVSIGYSASVIVSTLTMKLKVALSQEEAASECLPSPLQWFQAPGYANSLTLRSQHEYSWSRCTVGHFSDRSYFHSSLRTFAYPRLSKITVVAGSEDFSTLRLPTIPVRLVTSRKRSIGIFQLFPLAKDTLAAQWAHLYPSTIETCWRDTIIFSFQRHRAISMRFSAKRTTNFLGVDGAETVSSLGPACREPPA